MANLLEVLATCDSSNCLWTTSIWDPHTGTNLMTYKGGGTAESRTLSFIKDDYIASVEKFKPVLHIWPLNSHQTVQGIRFILPGKATALAFNSEGTYCLAGIEEKIYVWQVASGTLLTIINRHYQKVVQLKFAQDGRHFVSAAEDGMVMVWSLATVAAHHGIELVTQTTAGQHDPVYIFSDHSLPVTDLCISKTGMHGRLCTVSSDRTCKIYDLSSGDMLLNLVYDVPLSAIAMDVLELNIFVGTTEGKIHQFGLTSPPRNRDVLINSENESKLSFDSHTKMVTCLSVSLDGETLASGSSDELVILWHIRSKQPVRLIRHKGSVTNVLFTVNYQAIYKQKFSPEIVLHSLERSMETDENEVIEVDVLQNKKINFWPAVESNDYMPLISTSPTNNLDSDSKQKEVILQEDIEKLKAINANLYALSIKKILNSVPKVNNKKKKKNKGA